MKPLGSIAVQTEAVGQDSEVMYPSLRFSGIVSGFQLTPPFVVRRTMGPACVVPEAWQTVPDWQSTDPRYCASVIGSVLVLHVLPLFEVRRVIE
jgi:hypothetical protein